MYDLSAGADSWPVACYINSASGHFIAGLHFEHNDSLLRVQLSNKGTVLYLGTPKDESADLNHWQGKGGLKHAFIDTSKMVFRGGEQGGRLAGLQMLKEFEGGHIFAAQKHVPSSYSETTSKYVLGHVKVEEMDRHLPTTETSVTILEDMDVTHPNIMTANAGGEKELASQEKQVQVSNNEAWPALPTAKESHPHFSLADNGILLALAEARTGSSASKVDPASRVFIYRVPSTEDLRAKLLASHQSEQKRDLTDDGTAGNSEHQNDPTKEDHASEERKYTVRRLPLYLGAIKGKLMKFDFAAVDAGDRYQVRIVTDGGEKTWCVTHG